MGLPASVEGRERLRLFCGLPLPVDFVDVVAAWQLLSHLEQSGRPVPRENLHITLAFLGHRPVEERHAIVDELRAAATAAKPPTLRLRTYRETRSVGMLVFDDEGGRATALAGDLHERLERIGVYERERRPWLPHLTVLRFRERPRLRPGIPSPLQAPFSPSEAAVYHSVLRPTGAQYEVLDAVRLGG